MFPNSLNCQNDAMERIAKSLSTRKTSSEKREGADLDEDINAPPAKRTRPETAVAAIPSIRPTPTPFFTAQEEDVDMGERIEEISKRDKGVAKKLIDGVRGGMDQIVECYTKPAELDNRFLVNMMPMRLTNVDKSKDMPEYEMAIIQTTRMALENKVLPEALYNEILNLSDATFEYLMSTYGFEMGFEILATLTGFALSKHSRGELLTQDNRKFKSMLQYGYFPHLSVEFPSMDSIRRLYGCLQKLIAIDEDMMIDHLLVPMIGTKGGFVKVLYGKVNSKKLLEGVLNYLRLILAPLTPAVLIPLSFLLEKETELTATVSQNLFKTIRNSVGYAMTEKLAGFYTSIMTKFIHSMTEAELRQMLSLNVFNPTISSQLIQNMVDERLKSLKLSGLAESDSQNTQANSSVNPSPDLVNPSGILDLYKSFRVEEDTEMDQD